MAVHQVDVVTARLTGSYYNEYTGENYEVDGLSGVCRESGVEAEVYGTSDRSERALLAQVSEGCSGWHVSA